VHVVIDDYEIAASVCDNVRRFNMNEAGCW